MEIHELNTFSGTLGSGDYFVTDNGNDTSKVSAESMFAPLNARIDNIIAGPASSAQEVIDARLGADGVDYASLGEAIRTQFSQTLNLKYTFATRLSRATDFNTLMVGNYYVGSASDGGTMVNSPSRFAGRLIVLETYSASGNRLQMYFDSENNAYWRVGNSSSFKTWNKFATSAEVETTVDEQVSALASVVNQYQEPTSEFITANDAILANINDDLLFMATANSWTDTPTGVSGIFTTRRYSYNYNYQTFVELNTGSEYARIVNRDGTIYWGWTKQTDISQLKILALGDSICNGWRNNSKGFVGDLGLPYKNIGVSGASLSTKVTSVKNIPQQLQDETEYSPDIIIADGGINDYFQSAPMGTIADAPVANDTEANALDKSTVVGGLSYLFYLMIKKYPKAQRFFVITHKTKRQDTHGNYYAPTTNNAEGYNQQDLHDNIVAVCNLYNVKVIDVYKDSLINSLYSQYVSPTPYSEDTSVTNSEYVDSDGIHPLAYGYKEGYIPLVRQAIEIGTKK